MNKQQCGGCGAVLQFELPDAPGYVPKRGPSDSPLVCQRCFRIKNYNDATNVTVDPDQYLHMLGRIAEKDCLVVHIVDIFDFEGSLISGLKRFIGSNPVVLVVNKLDLLPKAINPNRIVNWVQRQAKEQGLKVAETVLCSAKRNFGFERVVESIGQHRGQRDVYVVGATNVGKSTLINRLIREYSDLQAELTTSRYPGTTLDLVRIPLDDGHSIIDTPGVVYRYRLTELVSKQSLQALLPEKPIKPAVYQLQAEQTLFFGSYARFDFIQGERRSFTCYVSNAIPIHRTKLSAADDVYAKHAGVMLAPPAADELAELPQWTRHSFSIGKGQEKDIAVSGLGWIRINGTENAQVALHAPKGIRVSLRDAMI